MKINDPIYGSSEIKEPVLIELLKSPSILRLKKISQFGVPDKYYHFKNFSRYEHSVGVMVLLKKLGASLEEQVAGLLHDVSVLTFSHVIDWVFANGRQGIEDYHDSIHEKFIRKTEVPKILKKHGFSLSRIVDERNFPLLERKAPDLCADRIDYALREFKYWLNPKIVKSCIKDLTNLNGGIVFSIKKSAFNFASNYLELQTRHWGGRQAIARYHLFSQALKMSLEKGILNERDFYQDEPHVLKKIERSKDTPIRSILKILASKSLDGLDSKSGIKILKKFRYVDPILILDGRSVRLSSVSPRFKKMIDKHRKINQEGLVV